MRSISAVLVAYGDDHVVVRCIEHLLRHNQVLDVFVIDNKSPNGESTLSSPLRQWSGRVHLLTPGVNLGYARGNNLGIRAALAGGSSHVLVCNPDITPWPGSISALAREFDDAGLSLISPQLVEKSDGIPVLLTRPGWNMLLGCGVLAPRRHPFIRDTFFGACWLASAELFADVGLLSEDFFLFGEEVDLAHRIERSGSHRWAVSSSIAVEHARGSSVTARGYADTSRSTISISAPARSAIVLARLHWPVLVPLWSMARVARALGLLLHGHPDLGRAALLETLSGLRDQLGG